MSIIENWWEEWFHEIRITRKNLMDKILDQNLEKPYIPTDLPPIVVPFLMRVLEPWTKGEAERSPEAMVLSFQVLEACSPVSCAA